MADASVPPAVYTEGKEVASPGSLEKTEEQHPTFTPSSQSVKLEANTHSMPVTQGGVQREGVEAPGDTSDDICLANSHPGDYLTCKTSLGRRTPLMRHNCPYTVLVDNRVAVARTSKTFANCADYPARPTT